LEQAQRTVDDGLVIEPRLQGRLDYMFAIVLQSLDRSGEAIPHLERAYRHAIADEGVGSTAAGLLIEVYSVALVDMQRTREAIDITRSNYVAAKAHNDMPLVRRTNFASAYGYALLKAGRAAEAETAYREALAWDERLYGVGNLSTDVALNNVGATLRAQDKFAEAAVFAERVLALRRAHLAPDSSAIARSSAVLGNTYRGAGDIDRAIVLIGAGLATFEKRGEADTAAALSARLNLAYALETKGRLAQARETLAPMLAHTRRAASQYAGAGGTDILLLHARLQARLAADAVDCSEPRAALDVAPGSSAQASEAHILAADCEWRHGRTSPAQRHLQAIVPPAPLQTISPYARTRLAELQRAMPGHPTRTAARD
jgi:tetratricopeptide (TPR) repeat protein